MKKLLLICTAMIAIGMMAVSCSKDNEENIVGKWRIQSTEGLWGVTISDGSSDIPEDTIVYEDNWGWLFNEDGTGYSYEITNGAENVLTNLTYYVDGDSLHITYSNHYRIDWGIDKLTNRKLRLSMRTEVTDVDGNFVRYSYSYLNFKRM